MGNGALTMNIIQTFVQLQQAFVTEGQRFTCVERASAEYTVQPAGYVALTGDVTFVNSLVGALQTNSSEFFTSNAGVTTDIELQALLNRGFSIVIDSPITASKAGLESLPNFGIMAPSGIDIKWINDNFVTLESGVDVRHIFTGSGSANSNVNYINPQIDGGSSNCNGIGGANSSGSRLENVHVIGGTFKNIKHSFEVGSLGGGRGVTFQYGVSNCTVSGGTTFINCYQPCDVAGNNGTESHGIKDGVGIVFADYVCENCGKLGGSFNLNTQTAVPLGLTPAVFANISFKNCGASESSWPGLSFTRVNATGNSDPFGDVFRAATTYDGNWEASVFSAADPEWNEATSSYALTDRVKITNNGQLSALFAFQGDGGVLVSNISGTNDSSYPTIGAIVSGVFSALKTSNINVNVNCDYGVKAGPTPAVYPVNFRYYDKVIQSEIEFTNIGNTGVVAYGSLPVNTAAEYQQEGLIIKGRIRRTALTTVINDKLGAAANGHKNYVEAHDIEQTVSVAGNFDFVYLCQNTLPSGGFSGGFNNVSTMPAHIKVRQSNSQLRLERTGSSAGAVDLYGSSAGLNSSANMQLVPDAGEYKAKSPDGTNYKLTPSNGGGSATWVAV
jgi:hypothetical protein